MSLSQWAARNGVAPAAMVELRLMLGIEQHPYTPHGAERGESTVQSEIRIEASQKGIKLFRNNIGVLRDERGVPVRYGLANDSKQMNETIKSGDLIGLRPVTITDEMVGWVLGQFVSVEVKHSTWRYTGTPHERAQLAWAQLVIANGGDARFATRAGDL